MRTLLPSRRLLATLALTLALGALLAGCPVFTRGEGASRAAPGAEGAPDDGE